MTIEDAAIALAHESNFRHLFAEMVSAVVDTTCDSLPPESGDPSKRCGHGIQDHNGEGSCSGSWHHSRCGSDHDCPCERSREELVTLLRCRFTKPNRYGDYYYRWAVELKLRPEEQGKRSVRGNALRGAILVSTSDNEGKKEGDTTMSTNTTDTNIAGSNPATGNSPTPFPYITPSNTTPDDIRSAVAERFTYKPWTAEQVENGKQVTGAATDFGVAIMTNVPPCPTRTRALNLIEEARMLANAAITHNGKF